MTRDELKDLKAGDMVHLDFVVRAPCFDGVIPVLGGGYVATDSVSRVTKAPPPPIRVGDLVRGRITGMEGDVISIAAGRAFVLFTPVDAAAIPLENLTRIERPKPAEPTPKSFWGRGSSLVVRDLTGGERTYTW